VNAMTFDLEEDFENERWRLLALVDRRKSLRDGSEAAITTDLEIVATRELVRNYETLKGVWSRKVSSRVRQSRGESRPEVSRSREPEAPVPALTDVANRSFGHSRHLD
jgi:hypothetical protein